MWKSKKVKLLERQVEILESIWYQNDWLRDHLQTQSNYPRQVEIVQKEHRSW